MLNDFELYNVHAESAEIEKQCILSIKVDYAEYNRKCSQQIGKNLIQVKVDVKKGIGK